MAETGTTSGITAAMAETRKLHSPHRRATPDQPPYSVMIEEAIRSLAEAGGTTVVAIDRHIRSAHRNLPWGHRNLLPYYHGKLDVAAGGIARTHSGRYSLCDGSPCCADAEPQPPLPLPQTYSSPPPPKPSEGENATPSPSYFSTGLPHELSGHDDGLGNGDLVCWIITVVQVLSRTL